MNRRTAARMALVIACLVATAVFIAGCEQSGGDPFQAGQAFRDQVDIVLGDAGRFVAGFCSSALLPGLVAALFAWVTTSRRGA